MKEINFRTSGICARAIKVVVDDNDNIKDIAFDGGCDGNHKGIVSLCIGMNADEVIRRLEGIKCGFKNSSCPDQLAQALKQR